MNASRRTIEKTVFIILLIASCIIWYRSCIDTYPGRVKITRWCALCEPAINYLDWYYKANGYYPVTSLILTNHLQMAEKAIGKHIDYWPMRRNGNMAEAYSISIGSLSGEDYTYHYASTTKKWRVYDCTGYNIHEDEEIGSR